MAFSARVKACLVPVRLSPRPSRSIDFSNVTRQSKIYDTPGYQALHSCFNESAMGCGRLRLAADILIQVYGLGNFELKRC